MVKCILLVEDNDALRETLSEQLNEAGFHVREAKDTDSALRVFNLDPAIDFLLTDFRLDEKKNGVELALDLRTLQPKLPVLILTGYPAEAAAAAKGRFRIVGKPIPQSQLLKVVTNELG